MSDFHQNGLVTVLHRLGNSNLEQLEKELKEIAESEMWQAGAWVRSLRPERQGE